MLLDEFDKWKRIEPNHICLIKREQENFLKFYRDYLDQAPDEYDPLADLAYQVYCLQVCMEGLLEDQDV